MRRALPLLIILLLAGFARAEEEVPPEKRVGVRHWTPASHECYVGQAFDVNLVVYFDRAFLDRSAVPLFRRDTDLPLHIRVPWLRALPGAQPLARVGPDFGRGLSFALNDSIIRVPPGEETDSLILVVTFIDMSARFAAIRPGTLVIPAVHVRFAYATKFEEDFVGGRVAVDRKDVTVTGTEIPIEVKPLPEDGRPSGFGGAVGRFQVSAEADESPFERDGSIHLTLRFQGTGNFETWPAPHLEFDGFHVYGVTEKKEMAGRTITYEIAPTSLEATTIPAIPFAFFDPAEHAYRIVETDPLPLSVRMPADAVVDPPVAVATPPGEEEGRADRWRPWRICIGMWLVGMLLAAYLRLRGNRVQGALASAPLAKVPDDTARVERVGAATAALQAALGSAEALDDFAEFLAAHLDVTAAAVIAPDLAVRLREAGVPDDLADRAAAFLEHGIAVRYGGPSAETAPTLDAELVAALQEALAFA